jgi:hypothetical protein
MGKCGTTEQERAFRELALAEIDQDIKNASVPMAEVYGNDMYPLLHQLQRTRRPNQLVKLLGDLVIHLQDLTNGGGGVHGSSKSDNTG